MEVCSFITYICLHPFASAGKDKILSGTVGLGWQLILLHLELIDRLMCYCAEQGSAAAAQWGFNL